MGMRGSRHIWTKQGSLRFMGSVFPQCTKRMQPPAPRKEIRDFHICLDKQIKFSFEISISIKFQLNSCFVYISRNLLVDELIVKFLRTINKPPIFVERQVYFKTHLPAVSSVQTQKTGMKHSPKVVGTKKRVPSPQLGLLSLLCWPYPLI